MTPSGAIWLACDGFQGGDLDAFSFIVLNYINLNPDINRGKLAEYCHTARNTVTRWAYNHAHPGAKVQEMIVDFIRMFLV